MQQKIQPMVLSICRELPALMASQQRLAGSLPAFRPYATLEQRDIENAKPTCGANSPRVDPASRESR